MCLEPEEARGLQSHWLWSCTCMLAAMSLLWMKPWSSVRAEPSPPAPKRVLLTHHFLVPFHYFIFPDWDLFPILMLSCLLGRSGLLPYQVLSGQLLCRQARDHSISSANLISVQQLIMHIVPKNSFPSCRMFTGKWPPWGKAIFYLLSVLLRWAWSLGKGSHVHSCWWASFQGAPVLLLPCIFSILLPGAEICLG